MSLPPTSLWVLGCNRLIINFDRLSNLDFENRSFYYQLTRPASLPCIYGVHRVVSSSTAIDQKDRYFRGSTTLKTILRFDLNAPHTCTFLSSNLNFSTVHRNSLTVRKTRRIYAHTDIRVAVPLLHYTLRFENGQAPVCENTHTHTRNVFA